MLVASPSLRPHDADGAQDCLESLCEDVFVLPHAFVLLSRLREIFCGRGLENDGPEASGTCPQSL